ncbi:hypothetical protein KDV38_19640 [Providencia rettgeri]
MQTLKPLLLCSLLVIAGCSTKELRDFARSADPTGIAKIATQSSVDEEKRLEAQRKKEIEAIKAEQNAKDFIAARDKWVNKSIDDLVLKWGNPYEAYPRTDGGRHTTYRKLTDTIGGVFTNYTYYYCLTTFISDSKGIITSWTSTGHCDYVKE